MMRRFVALAALLASPALAGEYLVLSNGFRIHAVRHEKDGDRLLIATKDGSLEFDAATVVEVQTEEALPEASPPAASPPIPALPTLSPRELVTDAAVRQGLPPELVHGIARVESNYNANAVSRAGARGIMQLMPATARYLQADPDDPRQNVEAGARYLRELLIRYQNDPEPVRKALAAYNAGPGAVDEYKGVPPYRETQLYVEKVLQQYWKLKK